MRAAGHSLQCIDILSFDWDPDRLLAFVEGKEPVSIMNHTAPAVKNGDIVPAELSFDEAVMMMVSDPILIKRPLIEVDGQCIQGFLDPRLKYYLGDWDRNEDVVTCPNLRTLSCDQRKL